MLEERIKGKFANQKWSKWQDFKIWTGYNMWIRLWTVKFMQQFWQHAERRHIILLYYEMKLRMLEIYWRDCHCEDGSIFDLIILCKIRIICYLFISEFPTFSICVFCLVWAGVLLWFQPCGLHFMPAYHSHLVRSGKQVW